MPSVHPMWLPAVGPRLDVLMPVQLLWDQRPVGGVNLEAQGSATLPWKLRRTRHGWLRPVRCCDEALDADDAIDDHAEGEEDPCERKCADDDGHQAPRFRIGELREVRGVRVVAWHVLAKHVLAILAGLSRVGAAVAAAVLTS